MTALIVFAVFLSLALLAYHLRTSAWSDDEIDRIYLHELKRRRKQKEIIKKGEGKK